MQITGTDEFVKKSCQGASIGTGTGLHGGPLVRPNYTVQIYSTLSGRNFRLFDVAKMLLFLERKVLDLRD